VRPEECATAAIAGDRLVVGSRAGKVVALSARDGRVLWESAVGGAIDAAAAHDPRRGRIYIGSDDGTLRAFDASSGAVAWTYRARGSIERAPALDGDALYVTTSADRIVSLDAETGKFRWQYDREPPEGFTIHGHAGPRVAGGLVLTGFSDGFLVALQTGTGELVWARSLAGASEQFVDVDSTPTVHRETVVAASYSGGLHGLSLVGGEVRWRLSVEGAGTINAIGDQLFFAAPREGLGAMTPQGQVLWRQGLADAGDLTPPVAVGPMLLFTGSRAGLFAVDRATGALLEVFNPGRGMCGGVALDPASRRAYVLANSGWMYALDLSY
jgi:outer membrane protein assembly factor BamB